jgi:hypothetical protein
MTSRVFLGAAALLSLERMYYVYIWRAPERLRRFCRRPAAAYFGEPVHVIWNLFYNFKGLQVAVFIG